MRSFRMSKILLLLIPILLLVVALETGSTQDASSYSAAGVDALFSPVETIYEYVKAYFYEPERIDDQEALYSAMKGVVEHLDDPYSEFFDPDEKAMFDEYLEGEFSGVGIEITLVDGILTVITPLVGTPAEAAGVQPGDRITRIDGESTEGITLSEASYRIRGETGTEVVLTILHEDGEIVDIPIVRDTIVIDPVDTDLLAEGTIGYIRLLRFEERDSTTEIDEAIAELDLDSLAGLILDLRNNGGGYMPAAIEIAGRFVDDGIVLQTSDRLSGDRRYWSRGNRVANVPLVVLINRGTASAAEILAGAIRDNNMGVLVGEPSFGKGVYQQLIDFEDGSALKITIGEYYTPSGAVVDGVGLTPDIEVGDDEDAIDVAIDWINEHVGLTMPIELDTAASP